MLWIVHAKVNTSERSPLPAADPTPNGMTAPTDRVKMALAAKGLTVSVREFPQSTRTADDAARAVGTSVSQIVKSLVFLVDESPVLVLVSGANRVDLHKLATASAARVAKKADADLVRRVTGFAVGGVPPVGHADPLPVYIDQDLMAFPVVYAAAGTPTAVFEVDPHRLAEVTAGTVIDLRES